MINASRLIPQEEYFVFYGNTDSPDGGLHHTGDDPTGGNSAEGDDETIAVDLSKVDPAIQEILFVVTIHEAIARKQNYGQVRNSYIRIVDDTTGAEVAKYELGEDFSIETAIEFGRLYKRNDKWKFEASGIGYKEDLAFFLAKYYKGQIIK
jgi:tellurium resistance protein TerD